eukprot:CAMPEP_0181304692 /NCGR_PEP_ID=MMETSP1101-20121128/9296_1 /TAXON_ID=46948 /ORGANISM="Rhodomonas abbreviata, Strain Caron Lab Isolate" /LENGTH=266 /DNA_ID=CAMNT_0023410487 /DNA_START=13 /DNA_END=809 /DNA_ORIENTATION=-
MAGGIVGMRKMPLVLGAGAMALCLMTLLITSSQLKAQKPTELTGGIMMGGVPPEGVLDDMMDNVDPSDPYGGPVWGMQSGDIGMGEYAARPQKLWGFSEGMQHHEEQPLYVGDTEASGGPPPSYEAEMKDADKARQMKLWGFNLGYEHHEQPPIFMGSGARNAPQVEMESPRMQSLAAAEGDEASKARQMKLWGFNMGYEHHEQPPIYMGSGARNAPQVAMESPRMQSLAAAEGDEASKARQMKLWSFNMGYEHHEQPPIYMGSGA